ncbi:MAG: LytTR family DNA-binding domain-containing protein [Chitinophagaceae bacterium]|nr:LytTR family DNA-binding domain-containing protein [Chitinophagaceae bacterium]
MKKYKTLIVEDNPDNLRDLRFYLDEKPHVLVVTKTVSTFNHAIDLLLEESFEVTILDIELPDGFGFDIPGRVPILNIGEIVFCSSYGDKHYEKVVNSDYTHFLIKPISKEKICAMILDLEKAFTAKREPEQFIALFEDLPSAKKFLVPKTDIFYIEYQNELSYFHYRKNGNNNLVAIQKTGLTNLLNERLNDRFVKCNKNCILNVDFFNEHEPYFNEGWIANMPNGQKIEISRTFKDSVIKLKGIS